jgi:hypothetical protein
MPAESVVPTNRYECLETRAVALAWRHRRRRPEAAAQRIRRGRLRLEADNVIVGGANTCA